MPREYARIPAREKGCSDRGGGVPGILILWATTVLDHLASEEVVWTFFLRVRVRIGVLGVTLESISSGKIGTRHWTGKQGTAAAVAAEEHPPGNLVWLPLARQDTKEVLDGAAWLFHGHTVSNPDSWIFLYCSIYIMNGELMFADGAGTTTQMVPTDYGGHVQRCTEISWKFSAKLRRKHSHHISQLQLIWRPATICHMGGFTTSESWVEWYSPNRVD